MKKSRFKLLSIVTTICLVSSFSTARANTKKLSDEEFKKIISEYYQNSKQSDQINQSLKSKLGIKDKDSDWEQSKAKDSTDGEKVVRVLVQLEDKPAIKSGSSLDSKKAVEKSLKDEQKDVISEVEQITGSKVKRSFGYLLNGFSIEAKKKDISKIGLLKGVKNVSEARTYHPQMTFAKQITGATKVWQNNKYKGEGMVVAIIDTGIDYKHKDLKITDTSKEKLTKSAVSDSISKLNHGKYYTDKVPYAYNYADNNDNVIDTTGVMHGMHVAGIVAANGSDDPNFNSVMGVAPEAQLLDMKVFSNTPNVESAYDDDVIAAIEDSVKLGADVINMSLGSESGFSDAEDPEQTAVKNATDAGVMVVVSAGNSGESTNTSSWEQPTNIIGMQDTATVGAPGTTPSALTVASMENSNIVVNKIEYAIGTEKGYMSYATVENDDYTSIATPHQLVDCGIGQPSDFKDKDLTGKIALIKRGTLSFNDKVTNAQKAGAIGAVIYNNDEGGTDLIQMSVSNNSIPALSVSNVDGNKLLKNIATATIAVTGAKGSQENPDKDDMSQYSSWGPTESLDFKPEITAPGGDIYSLANNNSYQSMSGTSMSSPNTAGSQALLIQSIKERGLGLTGNAAVKFAKNSIMNTATVMYDKYNKTVPYSPRRQGAGLINLPSAVTNNVIITDSTGNAGVTLRSFTEKTKTFDLTLKNYGKTAVTYNVPKSDLLCEKTDANSLIHEAVVTDGSVSTNTSTITVPANGTATIKVTVSIPDQFKADNFVEGFVKFDSATKDAPSLSVPFMGFYGDWAALNIIDKPAYDKDTISGATCIGTVTKNGFVSVTSADPNETAFSPNGDNSQDSVVPNLYLLRNAKHLTTQILDSNKNVIATLDTGNNVSKTSLEKFIKKDTIGRTLTGAKWDGTIYDASTGSYKKQADGQYYYRIIATADLEGAKDQVVDMPVKIDTAAPTLKLASTKANPDGTYHVAWTGNDAGSGVYNDRIYLSVNNEVVIISKGVSTNKALVKNFVANGNSYSADIAVTANTRNDIRMGLFDNAGNLSITSTDLAVGDVPQVQLFNLDDNMYIGPDSVDKKVFTIQGQVSSNISTVSVNGTDVQLEDNGYLNADVNVVEGANTVVVSAKDSSGKEVFNHSYKFTVDTTKPELKITVPGYTDQNSIISSTTSSIDITGNVTDANLAEVRVNGLPVDKSAIDSNGNFKATIKLVDGLNSIYVECKDICGNVSNTFVKVNYADPKKAFNITFDNLSSFMTLNAKDVPNGVYTVKGSVNHTVKTFLINDTPVTVDPKNNTFAVDVKLKQGTNIVKVYAEENGTALYNFGYRVLFDSKAPSFTLTSPVTRSDGKIYTNSNNVNLVGTASDNLYGYTFYVDGNAIFTLDRYPSSDSKVLTKDFNVPLKVKDGDIVSISLIDEFANKTEQKIPVVIDTVAPNAPKITLSTTDFTNKALTASISDTDTQIDHFEYSFDGKSFSKYDGSLNIASNCKVYARAIDYAGNVSEVASLDVTNIDTTAPTVNVAGINNNGVYTQAITPAITADDKQSGCDKIVATLNGAPYTLNTPINKVGSYNLEVYAVDKVGNKSSVITKHFDIKLAVDATTANGKTKVTVGGTGLQAPSILGVSATGAPSYEVDLPASLVNSDSVFAVTGDTASLSLPMSLFTRDDHSTIRLLADVNTNSSIMTGMKFAGKAYNFSLFNVDEKGVQTPITKFNGKVVTVTMKLTDADLKGLDTAKLTAYSYNETTKTWDAVGGTYDAATKSVTFSAPHFSTYAIAEKTAVNPPNPNPQPGNPQPGNPQPGTGNQNNGSNTNSTIVKTGSVFGSTVLGVVGVSLVISGAAILFIKRRKF